VHGRTPSRPNPRACRIEPTVRSVSNIVARIYSSQIRIFRALSSAATRKTLRPLKPSNLIMSSRQFAVIEDPEHPGRLLYRREDYEIENWIRHRERVLWSRLIAFQLIYGSLLWLFLFGRFL